MQKEMYNKNIYLNYHNQYYNSNEKNNDILNNFI